MAKDGRKPFRKLPLAIAAILLVFCFAGSPPDNEETGLDIRGAAESPTAIDEVGALEQGEPPSVSGAPVDSSSSDGDREPLNERDEEYGGGNISPADFPSYTGSPSVKANGNTPIFDDGLLARAEDGAFEEYYPLDSLGRATGAVACAGPETMPEGERGSIGRIKPTGFSLDRYDWVDGKYLYNRCHLIAWQLTGENSDMRNLVTGTRYMNVDGMLPYENRAAAYIESTGNHVLYRATPIFEGEDLVARGVLLEAISVEDGGAGLSFSVFCFNVQPGVSIDYATGANEADGTVRDQDLVEESQFDYILNTNTKKIHEPDCPSVDDMKEKNKRGFNGTVEEATAQGYSPCGRCRP